MKRNPLYGGAKPPHGSERGAEDTSQPPLRRRLAARWRSFHKAHERAVIAAGCGLAAVAAFGAYIAVNPPAHRVTQAEIDAAVAYALKHRPVPPSTASVAAETVRPSVVRVTGYDTDKPAPEMDAKAVPGVPKGAQPLGPDTGEEAVSVGSGVVIDERGTILTNLHVAASAKRLKVTFANGEESDAYIVGAQPQDDLAVIRATVVPDDLKPATLVSTRGMKPGDEVVAVGFPFAIGPSVSAGVVSGLKRSWATKDPKTGEAPQAGEGREGGQNLIQFDAAANPGNSGGPLVNRNGEVVGIVTGILNPTKQRVFIGIGFAVPIENAAAAAGQSPF
ncbi:MAG TPA: trypsin-like peptidase domain-containing protein [Caulobacteraceae bacterium]|jgi:S1-C subfamily serine protease|nr:trypsin-like peptidase domain-containing protein [Caulobacteraceae bacterium]